VSADRDSLFINWGDGTFSSIARSNGKGEPLQNNIKKNIYISEHTYPGRGTYKLSVTDPNRVESILNIDPPNSVNIPFYIESIVTLLNLQFQFPNHSVQLLQAPIDFGCVGQVFVHNPAAYDMDGDSLYFELIVPQMDINTPVPNYSFPNQIQAGINNNINFDSKTGTFTWNVPQRPGEYNIAFVIHEYRKGVKIGSTVRDMQILIRNDCNTNRPPVIKTITDTCLVAGSLLKLNIQVSDPDTFGPGSKIKIEGIGAPFIITPKATLSVQPVYLNSPAQVMFEWQTDCSLIQKEYYTLVIKATDNYLDTTGLSYLHVIRIKVTGPAPENLESEIVTNTEIQLKWTKPYVCDSSQLLFRGFSVWRREGTRLLKHDTCNPGLNTNEYRQIAYLVNSSDLSHYIHKDTQVVKGRFYCYRVLAEFARISSKGFPVNFVSSLHSNETCNFISFENPLVLNVDVQHTDEFAGEMYIKWQKAKAEIFDTTKNTPPYVSTLQHKSSTGLWSEITASRKIYSSYASILDTSFIHLNINTKSDQYTYRVNIKSLNASDYLSDSAQSLYLISTNSDRQIHLSWLAQTPWNNYSFIVYRFNNTTNQFDSIAHTPDMFYIDQDLINGQEYCYYIKSLGEYGINTIEHPLINKSNVLCAIPIDNVPPCCPKLSIKGPCDETHLPDPDKLVNTLSWTNPNPDCLYKDAVAYNIYALNGTKKELLKEINDIQITSFEHTLNEVIPICYQITAVDILGNECISSDSVCVEYCPNYKLPNTFTPNGDGHNDIFKPYPYLFIEKINLKIFNRWGNLVFKTQNPEINWDGTSLNGSKLSDGVYYYQCDVYYAGHSNTSPRIETLTGFIELLSGIK
jgi:gliding motility-associated-like protein